MEKRRSARSDNDEHGDTSAAPTGENLPTTSQNPTRDFASSPSDGASSKSRESDTDSKPGDSGTIVGISHCQVASLTITSGVTSHREYQPIKEVSGSSVAKSGVQVEKDIRVNEAVQKIRKAQIDTFQLDLLDMCEEDIPEVHPRIVKVFENDDFLKEDTYKPTLGDDESFYEKEGDFNYGKEATFEEFLQRIETNSFVTLSGFPGSGKTTLVKRLGKAFCKKTKGLCFYLEFCHINYPNSYTLNLRQLLLDKAYPDFTEQIYKDAFEWVLKNQEKCLIVLDGYDRAEWSLNEVGNPTNQNCNDPQNIRTLVANLCRNHFLRKTCVILTSRPHKVTSIPSALQPGLSFMIADFSLESAEKLFLALAKENSEQLGKNLIETASQLVRYCFNPLILQLYIRTCGILKNDINKISTLTEIYTTVLLGMKKNTRYRNMDKITDQLSSLAFAAIKNCRLAIIIDEQTKRQLEIEDIPTFIRAVGKCMYRPKTFKQNKHLYFLHQSLLEYFAAHYIAYKMELSDYNEFVEVHLFTDQWAIVRRFLCGILLNNKEDAMEKLSLEGILILKKKSKVEDLLCTHFKTADRRELAMLCNDVWECDNDDLTSRVVAAFPKRVSFQNILISSNDAHSIGYIIKKVNQNLQEIVLENSFLNGLSFKSFCKAIKGMRGLIGRLDIRYNRLSSADTDKICDILPKITDVLMMRECFADGEGRRSANNEERKQIQSCLNQLSNSKLRIVVAMENGRAIILKKQCGAGKSENI